MKSKLLALVFMAALFVSSACSLDKIYVQADRDTYDVVAPAHEEYVKNDPNMTDEQKERRLRLLKSWDERIKAAEDK